MAASDDILYLAQRFQGILDLVPTLQKVESLSNHQRELEATVKQLQISVEETKVEIASNQSIVKDLESKAKATVSDIKSHETKLETLKKHLSDLKSKF